ncbi:MAG: hypothetical protein WCT26_03010 [Candidatus Buchananbacteria bacterium]|jgi:Holliday junction resolvase-like predicted endonuclease
MREDQLFLQDAENLEVKSSIPFDVRELKIPFDFADISHIDFEQQQAEVFHAWYDHQDEPVIKSVSDIMIAEPQTAIDYLQNLLASSYLFGKRAAIRREVQNQSRLAEVYPEKQRNKFAIDDAAFQQDAVIFLSNNKNHRLEELFWEDFQTNQALNRKGEKEQSAGKRGILAMKKVIDGLTAQGFEVYLPDPKIDAVEKIDLVAVKADELLFIQVKSQNTGKNKGDKYKQDKLEIFHDAVSKYSGLVGREITGKVVEV